jgi:uncharacterized protein (TIRG00374 family)
MSTGTMPKSPSDAAQPGHPGLRPSRDRVVRNILISVAKLALGVGLTYWLLASGRLDPTAFRKLSGSDAMWLLVGIVMAQLVSLVLVLARWWLLLRVQGIGLTLRSTLVISFRGVFAGLLVPGIVGLDGARVIHLKRSHPDKLPEGLASMVLDRVIGFLALLILAALFGSYFLLGHWDERTAFAIGALTFLTIALAAALASACGLIPDFGLRAFRRFRPLAQFVRSFETYRNHRSALVSAVALSLVAHFLTCVAACGCLAVLDASFSWIAVLSVTPLIIVIRFLPLTPLGLGVSDGAAEEIYRLIGVTGGAEAQMLLRAVTILLFLLSGLAFLMRIDPRDGAK